MTSKVKDFPASVCPFKKGDVVEVSGKLYKGLGKIQTVLLKWPKGEASYDFSYQEPLPQALIKLGNGKILRYNGEDFHQGKIKVTDKKMRKPKSLFKTLESIIIDTSEADLQLGYEAQKPQNLISNIDELIPFLTPLLKQKVYYDGDELFELGEFDKKELIFTSVKVGKEMRNRGVPAFVLTIYIDGYAPTTFSLKVNETYFWGEE